MTRGRDQVGDFGSREEFQHRAQIVLRRQIGYRRKLACQPREVGIVRRGNHLFCLKRKARLHERAQAVHLEFGRDLHELDVVDEYALVRGRRAGSRAVGPGRP